MALGGGVGGGEVTAVAQAQEATADGAAAAPAWPWPLVQFAQPLPASVSSSARARTRQGCVRREGGTAPGASGTPSGVGAVLTTASWLWSHFAVEDSGAPGVSNTPQAEGPPTLPAFSRCSAPSLRPGAAAPSASPRVALRDPARDSAPGWGAHGALVPPVTCQGLGPAHGHHSRLARGGRADQVQSHRVKAFGAGLCPGAGAGTVLPRTPSLSDGTRSASSLVQHWAVSASARGPAPGFPGRGCSPRPGWRLRGAGGSCVRPGEGGGPVLGGLRSSPVGLSGDSPAH